MSENRTIAKWLSGFIEAATSFLAEFCKKRTNRALLLWAYLLFVLPIGLVLPADHGRNIILILGGTAAGFIAVWRALVADKQNKINEQSQITERFTRAVDQLGSESIYMRIGALHALERIGHDMRMMWWQFCAYFRILFKNKARLKANKGLLLLMSSALHWMLGRDSA